MHRCLPSRYALLLVFAVMIVARPALGEAVTVMSYNVENMFDVFDDPYTGDEGTEVKRHDEIAAIAKAIATADADIVVFQELENEHLLAGMVKTFLGDAGYDYIACQRTNSGRGINLGVISRYPITRLASYRFRTLAHPGIDPAEQTWRFARDVMHATFDIEGVELHALNVHLKSNSSRPDDPNSRKWRTAEAAGLEAIMRGLVKANANVYAVAMGDFNSNIETRPEQPRPWPATQLLRKAKVGDSKLFNDAHDGQPYEKRTTLPGNDRYPPVIFDYIYASPALHKHLVKNSAKVIRSEELVSGSDHFPIYATYDIPAKIAWKTHEDLR